MRRRKEIIGVIWKVDCSYVVFDIQLNHDVECGNCGSGNVLEVAYRIYLIDILMKPCLFNCILYVDYT